MTSGKIYNVKVFEAGVRAFKAGKTISCPCNYWQDIQDWKNGWISAKEQSKEPDLQEAIMIVGLPGACKTSFYQALFRNTHVRVNLQMLRNNRNREKRLVETLLDINQSFVIDNTNLSTEDRARYTSHIKEKDFKLVGYRMNSPIEDCKVRNSLRWGKEQVPNEAIDDMFQRLECPEYEEGFDVIYNVYPLPGPAVGQYHFKIDIMER